MIKKFFIQRGRVLILAFLAGFLIWNFFFCARSTSYPWWVRIGNDIDSVFAAETVAMLNDLEPATHMFYPAMTNYNFSAFCAKIAAYFSPSHRALFNLGDITNFKDALRILDTATRLSRFCVFLISCAFAAVLFALFDKILNNKWLAGFWTFILISMERVLYHAHAVRPEALSLTFFFGAVLMFTVWMKSQRNNSGSFTLAAVFCGFLLSCALFTKIQIFLAVLFFTGFMSFSAAFREDCPGRGYPQKHKRWVLPGIALVNVLIFPWWALKKPYLVSYDYMPESSRYIFSWLYGMPPLKPDWNSVVIMFFIAAAALSLSAFFRKGNKSGSRFLKGVGFFNLTVLGGIIALYCVCLPGVVSFQGYLRQTQNLLYSTLSAIFLAGVMKNKVINFNTFAEIYRELAGTPVGFMNMFWLNIIILVSSLTGMLKKGVRAKRFLLWSVVCFILAFLYDIMATMRYEKLLHWYSIYAFCFYVTGYVLFTAAVTRNISRRKTRILFSVFLACVFAWHGVSAFQRVSRVSAQDMFAGQECLSEYNHNRWLSQPFWHGVDRALYKSEGFYKIRELGALGAMGNNYEKVCRDIADNLDPRGLVSEKDKQGKVDELIIRYTAGLKCQVYFYDYALHFANQAYRNGDYNAALGAYNQAVRIINYFPQGYYQRGLLFQELRHKQQAENDFFTARYLGMKIK